jgi:hypothetical protein
MLIFARSGGTIALPLPGAWKQQLMISVFLARQLHTVSRAPEAAQRPAMIVNRRRRST